MFPSTRSARRAVVGVIGAGTLAGAILFGAAGTAAADDPPPPAPPPCTAAELARVMSGVTFDTSNYLTLHPDVNDFFTSLKGQPKDADRGAGTAVSRRKSGRSGGPAAHPAALGRLPPTLWASADSLTVCGRQVRCGAFPALVRHRRLARHAR